MKYTVRAIKVKAGLFGTGDTTLEEAVEKELNQYAKQGWKLESISVSGSDRGSMALIVWKSE